MKKGTLLIAVGLALITSAAGLTAFNLWETNRAGKAADAVLTQLEPLIPETESEAETELPAQSEEQIFPEDLSEIEYPDYLLDPEREMPVTELDGDLYIGILRIPSLKLGLPVFSEWSDTNLKTAPCRYSGNLYDDDLVICAHDYRTHFGGLYTLKLGSEVTFTDMDGNQFLYEVMEISTLGAKAVREMTESEWDLTLFTCTIGGQERLTARCARQET